jgi:single-strand DNA-binding protein
MASVNKVILIGNLGADPEQRYTATGTAMATFNVATKDFWNNKEGVREERTEWHRIVAWGRLGEICGEYLSKGKQVYIEGKLRTRSWEDREGNKRYTTEILAQNMQMLGSAAERVPPERELGGPEPQSGGAMPDDDIPF